MRGLSVAEQGLRFIWDCFVKYQGTWAYLLLGALAVVLVLLYRKKEAAFLFLWYPLSRGYLMLYYLVSLELGCSENSQNFYF